MRSSPVPDTPHAVNDPQLVKSVSPRSGLKALQDRPGRARRMEGVRLLVDAGVVHEAGLHAAREILAQDYVRAAPART